MKPDRCYWICTSPRTGSTALCHALSMTGVAGNPGELLVPRNGRQETGATGHTDFSQSLDRAKLAGTSHNRTFGLKVMAGEHLDYLLDSVQTMDCSGSLPEALDVAFPGLRFVFLTRRNKVRQAVSHWRAIRSDQWHLTEGTDARTPPASDYSFDAIDTLVHDTVMREAAWQQLFGELEVRPLSVAYEDFALSPERITLEILDYLDLEPPRDWRLAEMKLRPVADELSEAWVQRYRQERQAEWKRQIW